MAYPSPPAGRPAGHPPGLAGRGCGDRVTPNTAGQELRFPPELERCSGSIPASPAPLLGGCSALGCPCPCTSPRCLPLWGHLPARFLLVKQWQSLHFLNLQESIAPIPAVTTFWQVPKSYTPSLNGDPHHLQSPPKPMLGHHMWHLV